MSAAANRVLNWNKPLVNKQLPDMHRRQLRACDVAIERGGRVVPMMMPQNGLIQHDFDPGYVFRALPGRGWLFDLDPVARRAAFGDPDKRRQLEQLVADATTALALVVRNWASYRVYEVQDPAHADLAGRSISELAVQWNCSPFDAMAELVHERELFTFEEMVHHLSGAPAALYGLTSSAGSHPASGPTSWSSIPCASGPPRCRPVTTSQVARRACTAVPPGCTACS